MAQKYQNQNNPLYNPFIEIKGARVHNLKNLSVSIPRNAFIVVTGLSGSGKSSLAFDTLYAEGQRRYIESLSSYARQFLGRINKPDVDYIKGIPPAIAIEQKVNTRNPRSTVGTSTEIYDYLKLLFARVGRTFSPVSGSEVKRQSVTDVIDYILSFPDNTKVTVLSKVILFENRTLVQQLDVLMKQGFTRVQIDCGKQLPQQVQISEIVGGEVPLSKQMDVCLLIDRFKVARTSDALSRMSDSVETAFYEGGGACTIEITTDTTDIRTPFSNRFEADGLVFEEPTSHMFSFNNPVGACPQCEGYGSVIGIDEELVVPNKSLSVYEDAVACWKGEKMQWFKNELIGVAAKFNFPIHKPYYQLSDEQRELLWTGNKYFEGLHAFFKMLEAESYKIQYRVMLSRYRGKTVCPSCKGSRLKKEASYVKVGGISIHELVLKPIAQVRDFFENLQLSARELEIGKRILIEIKNRLQFLSDVGLGYLTLNRLSGTLSGGESQRINLATSLGSGLVGSVYILDEPSIGLHSRDTDRLIKVLKHLKNQGNTVLVVEHDEEIIRESEYLMDIGPLAGTQGGELVFFGKLAEINTAPHSLTAQYLSGIQKIELPAKRRNWDPKTGSCIEIVGARENNLKNVSVKFPLQLLTVVTGVSGSGKSTLVKTVLFNALQRKFDNYSEKQGKFDLLQGDINLIEAVEMVDQNPIGKSSRSNPVTYIKAFDDIRKLFSEQQASKINDFKPAHFSFNVDGGRCDECQGEGEIKVEMQFMADVHLLCESCKGKRFKDEILEVFFDGKNIFDVLELTVDEAVVFFNAHKDNTCKKIASKLTVLSEVGLGYVKLGQSSSTLSGGESQRIKLASFLLNERDSKHTLFIFDEPTTGLHFHDIKKLMKAINALILRGNTVVIIEHNLDVIKLADWIIDLGPEGGNEGGNLVFEGTPEQLLHCSQSYTGHYLKPKLS